jgi:hypothetical protein
VVVFHSYLYVTQTYLGSYFHWLSVGINLSDQSCKPIRRKKVCTDQWHLHSHCFLSWCWYPFSILLKESSSLLILQGFWTHENRSCWLSPQREFSSPNKLVSTCWWAFPSDQMGPLDTCHYHRIHASSFLMSFKKSAVTICFMCDYFEKQRKDKESSS